ncbi:LuxR C-terminal-related transcriptional regulator [Nonomuraea sp. NPDC050556]|uniref:LuxR C-terminal-related transcriptional regulator n=1 Tax=Nonomuraea sp. NPDC050556 TaxID=3364369 RepID=UPI0037A56A07
MRVAVWRVESGTATDPLQLLSAWRIVWAAGDLDLATKLATAALDAGGGVQAAIALAATHNLSNRFVEAERALASVWELPCDERTHTELIIARAAAIGMIDHLGAAEQLLDEALPTLSNEENRQEIMILRASSHSRRGEVAQAEALAEQVFANPASPPLEAQARLFLAMAAAHSGKTTRAVDLARTAVARSADWREAVPIIVRGLHGIMADACRLAGDLDGLAATAASLKDHLEEVGESWGSLLILGAEARLRGDLARAKLLFEEASRQPMHNMFTSLVWTELALTTAMSGDGTAAQEAIALSEAALPDDEGGFASALDLVRPWAAAASGEMSRARDLVLDIAEQMKSAGLMGFELTALQDAVRLGCAPQVAERLAEVAEQHEGALAPLCAAHARHWNDGRELVEVAAGYERLGMLLFAAEAYAHAARAFDDSGRTASARSARARAWALAARCPGARVPALEGLRAPGLTRREHEIAALAATGVTSKEIADRLVLSVRTVDNHLQSAFGKLGISSRADLPGLLL